MDRNRLLAWVAFFLFTFSAGIAPALADSNSAALVQVPVMVSEAAAFRLAPGVAYGTVQLAPIEPGLIDEARQANTQAFLKKLQIGIGRPIGKHLETGGGSATWIPVPGGFAAHWEISSPGAQALRVGLNVAGAGPETQVRFAGRGQLDTVYGPYQLSEVAASDSTHWWSPVLAGDTAVVELFVASLEPPPEPALGIAQVSHLFVGPWEPAAENIAKASGACEVDFICRAAADSALTATGKSVAKMTFSDGTGSGSTYLCTGTLLNPIGGSGTPYFYSANHCISTQASASTLTTHWFYDRTGCGSGSTSPSYVQVGGGATLLYANSTSDALLLRLNSSPPAGAILSGWDSATLSAGAAVTAVHHPAGDWKKVSLANVGGFGSADGSDTNFIISNWTSGITEGGSSGSGLFLFNGSEYSLRGGLYGGPSSCTAAASSLYDYYSRFDQVYPAIAQYLNPATVSCSYTLSPTGATVTASATSGNISVTTTSGCSRSATSSATWLTSSGGGTGSGTLSYSIAANSGAVRTATLSIGGIPFTVTQQAPATAGANFLANPGFETGTASWSQSATGGLPIVYEDASEAHAGSWYAWLGGYDSGSDTIYQPVTIPIGGATSLRFWYWIESNESATSTTAFDTLTISINSATSGALLATLGTFSNVNRTSGWVQSPSYDVSAFGGQTVRLVFQARTDVSNITNFFIDDITLSSSAGGTANYTSLWWNKNESGWGLNVNHQGSNAFATLFTYDASGNPMWLVMSNGAQSGSTFSGPLYRTTGSAFNAVPFTPINAGNVTTVGTMTLSFSGDTGTLNYSVNGVNVGKSIEKQVFGSRAANCTTTTGSRAGLSNYQDLWWKGDDESGWGINLTHQDNTIFGTLFTYNASGQGIWWVTTATRQSDGSFLGNLLQTNGPAFNAVPFTPITTANITTVGTMRFTFTSGTTGTMTYSVNGANVTKAIKRQEFGSPLPACS